MYIRSIISFKKCQPNVRTEPEKASSKLISFIGRDPLNDLPQVRAVVDLSLSAGMEKGRSNLGVDDWLESVYYRLTFSSCDLFKMNGLGQGMVMASRGDLRRHMLRRTL